MQRTNGLVVSLDVVITCLGSRPVPARSRSHSQPGPRRISVAALPATGRPGVGDSAATLPNSTPISSILVAMRRPARADRIAGLPRHQGYSATDQAEAVVRPRA